MCLEDALVLGGSGLRGFDQSRVALPFLRIEYVEISVLRV
jgi:hypothetical protein